MMRYIAICGAEKSENSFLLHSLLPLRLHCPGLELVTFDQPGTLLEEYRQNRRFDLVLLDVGKNGEGLSTAMKLHQIHPALSLILLADNEKWAIPGYHTRACAYIPRPFESASLQREVYQALTHCETPDFYFSFFSEEGTVQIKHSEIFYFESDVRRITLVTKSGSYKFSGQISQIAQQLSPFGFIRTHKSYVVNLQHISNLFGEVITLSDGRQIPCSRMHRQEVAHRIIQRQPPAQLWNKC